jgi:hypothetical protein
MAQKLLQNMGCILKNWPVSNSGIRYAGEEEWINIS